MLMPIDEFNEMEELKGKCIENFETVRLAKDQQEKGCFNRQLAN